MIALVKLESRARAEGDYIRETVAGSLVSPSVAMASAAAAPAKGRASAGTVARVACAVRTGAPKLHVRRGA